jgi:hypothetical protein
MNIEGRDLDVCDECGALVWWDRVDKHRQWHESLPPKEVEK